MGTKILVIEDSASNRLLLRDILEAKGYLVIEAPDGKAGFELAKKELPALILLDIQMPVIDGFETCRLLRAEQSTARIKILGVTSYAMKGDREKVLSAGFDGYISKPLDTRKLPETVAALLAGRRVFTADKGEL